MDLFQHRYYRLNKTFMKLFGYWPYQSTSVRFVISAVVVFLTTSMLIPLVIAVVKHLDDRNLIMESAASLIFTAICFTKGFFCLLNSHKILKLLNHIRADWEVWARDCDVGILREYAENGRKWTIVSVVTSSTTITLFMTQPIIPKIIDVLLKNGTEPGQFPIPVEFYNIDMQKYYFYIILYFYVNGSIAILVTTACDSIFMVFVQHGCGLFAALGHKLERMGKNERSAEAGEIAYGSDKLVEEYECLTWCIDKHNDAIKYANLIDATYTWFFFIIVGLNMILISFIGFQITTKTNTPEAIIKFIDCILMVMVHLHMESYMGQFLIDYSISIHYYILNSKWYNIPLKAQKLLPLMMMRCNVPCKVSVGKTIFMSMQAYSAILKTSLSYYTLLRSVSS